MLAYVTSWHLNLISYDCRDDCNHITELEFPIAFNSYPTETCFSVQWENVILADFVELGNFSFQATLKNNGDIIFAYRDIPVNVTDIKSKAHPVKIGLADAYNIERRVFCESSNCVV